MVALLVWLLSYVHGYFSTLGATERLKASLFVAAMFPFFSLWLFVSMLLEKYMRTLAPFRSGVVAVYGFLPCYFFVALLFGGSSIFGAGVISVGVAGATTVLLVQTAGSIFSKKGGGTVDSLGINIPWLDDE